MNKFTIKMMYLVHYGLFGIYLELF